MLVRHVIGGLWPGARLVISDERCALYADFGQIGNALLLTGPLSGALTLVGPFCRLLLDEEDQGQLARIERRIHRRLDRFVPKEDGTGAALVLLAATAAVPQGVLFDDGPPEGKLRRSTVALSAYLRLTDDLCRSVGNAPQAGSVAQWKHGGTPGWWHLSTRLPSGLGGTVTSFCGENARPPTKDSENWVRVPGLEHYTSSDWLAALDHAVWTTPSDV